MIVLDVILMVGIAAVTAGFLIWAICTQYRDLAAPISAFTACRST